LRVPGKRGIALLTNTTREISEASAPTTRGNGRARAAGTPTRVPRLVAERGRALIGQPLLNKGTAFSAAERDAFSLRGLLPPRVSSIDEQVALELEHVRRKTDDLERYIGLSSLRDRNETLFYRVLAENLEEFLPIVYTPTVGRACQAFSHIFRRPRGAWITPDDAERMDSILRAAGDPGTRLVVATDNERILGLGDQGAGGMAIPVGKLSLYSAAAGIYPALTLPISLDVGTDRRELLDDPLYLGFRAPRLRGEAYDAFVEEFVGSVKRVFPAAVLQWEDFKQHNALRILDRYRHRLPSFNDDVQGTGAVAVAGLLAARGGVDTLRHDRILLLGAGGAAIGISRLLRHALGLGRESFAVHPRLVLMDSHGVVHLDRPGLPEDQRQFAVDPAWFAAAGLATADLADPVAVARALQATVLIGTTGTAGVFTEPLVREIARHAPRPIVLPLSNPSDRAEAQPQDVLAWSDGRALVATGSPCRILAPGRSIGQANNVFVFPGVGLAALVAEAREITDDAFLTAAEVLADSVTPERLAGGGIYPPIADLRTIARRIAVAVVRRLRDTGYGRQFRDEDIEPAVDRAMWTPEYETYVPA
jgi:malate dehydrogenase (oxaloacetate-decarboxylating)